MDIFESNPRDKFYDIVYNANRNLVEDEIDNLIAKLIAYTELAEAKGISEAEIDSFVFLNQDLINDRMNDIYIGSVANILSNNE